MNDFINSVFAWLENRRKAKEKEARQRDIEEIALIEAELGEWGRLAALKAPLILAIVINPWCQLAASILAHLWFIAIVIGMTMRRAPCYYGSYSEWYADRANWWKKFQ